MTTMDQVKFGRSSSFRRKSTKGGTGNLTHRTLLLPNSMGSDDHGNNDGLDSSNNNSNKKPTRRNSSSNNKNNKSHNNMKRSSRKIEILGIRQDEEPDWAEVPRRKKKDHQAALLSAATSSNGGGTVTNHDGLAPKTGGGGSLRRRRVIQNKDSALRSGRGRTQSGGAMGGWNRIQRLPKAVIADSNSASVVSDMPNNSVLTENYYDDDGDDDEETELTGNEDNYHDDDAFTAMPEGDAGGATTWGGMLFGSSTTKSPPRSIRSPGTRAPPQETERVFIKKSDIPQFDDSTAGMTSKIVDTQFNRQINEMAQSASNVVTALTTLPSSLMFCGNNCTASSSPSSTEKQKHIYQKQHSGGLLRTSGSIVDLNVGNQHQETLYQHQHQQTSNSGVAGGKWSKGNTVARIPTRTRPAEESSYMCSSLSEGSAKQMFVSERNQQHNRSQSKGGSTMKQQPRSRSVSPMRRKDQQGGSQQQSKAGSGSSGNTNKGTNTASPSFLLENSYRPASPSRKFLPSWGRKQISSPSLG